MNRTRCNVAVLVFMLTGGWVASAWGGSTSKAAGAPIASASESASASSAPSSDATAAGFGSAFYEARKARCATAVCWGGDGYEFAFEPLLELPIGKTFAVTGTQNSLGMFIDSHDFTVTFAAGLRFWVFDDIASIGVYLSQPLLTGDSSIQVRNSPVSQPVSNVRRPYPGFTLGLFGDLLWIGLDYQRLVNGDSSSRDPNYPASYTIAQAWSMTVGVAPGTGLRTGVATGLKSPATGNTGGSSTAASSSSATTSASSAIPASPSSTNVSSPGSSTSAPPASGAAPTTSAAPVATTWPQ